MAQSQNTLLEAAWRQAQISDPITLAGLHFPNRVGLAAGLDKNARCIDGLAAMGFGFVEVGTVTPKAQPGNPKPRMFRLPEANALINRFGFNNDGLEALYTTCSSRRCAARGKPLVLGLNIGKNASTAIENATQDYLTCLEGVYPHADYVTVNISSPNTQNLRALQSDEALDGLLGAIAQRREALTQKQGKRVPIFVKIAPDLTRYPGAGDRRHPATPRHGWGDCHQHHHQPRCRAGTRARYRNRRPERRPALETSNRIIRQLRPTLGKGYPIIGVGGILSAADALSKIAAGADVVQLYSGLVYTGPELVTQVAQALKQAPRA